MKIDKKFWIVLGMFIVIIIFLIVFFGKNDKKNIKKLDINRTSTNYSVEDDTIQFLYDRYHPEDGLKFQLVGSDSVNPDYYAFYYKNDKVDYKDFPSIYKNYILLELMNYKDHTLDEERNCYLYSLEEYKNAYQKYFGSLEKFEIDVSEEFYPHFYLDEENICISNDVEMFTGNYKKSIDTYMVNAVYQDEKIIIYERVAFVKVTDESLEFYKDYNMKNLVYSLDRENVESAFLNSSQVVSNVLVNYQDEFPMYQYTYIKGENTYYLESITK